jgi:hypothetical protein
MTNKPGSVVEQCYSSIRRGLVALVLAPALFALPMLAILLLMFNLGAASGDAVLGIREQMRDFGVVLLGLIGGTVLFGLPTWVVLRAAERESSLTYGLAGLAEGLFAAFYFGYSGSGPLRIDQAIEFVLVSLAGGAIALTFWRIVRVRVRWWITCDGSRSRQTMATDKD